MKDTFKVYKYRGKAIIAAPLLIFGFIYFIIKTFFLVTTADKRYSVATELAEASALYGYDETLNNVVEHQGDSQLGGSYLPNTLGNWPAQDTPLYYKYLLQDSMYRSKVIIFPYEWDNITPVTAGENADTQEEENVAWHSVEELSGINN